ncbi:MAG: tetratricopeptide repeat protein, partial [bacterium]
MQRIPMIPLPFRQRVFPLTALILFPLLLLGAGCSVRKAPETRSSAGELILLGRENMKDRNFERAREAFNRILQEYPESNVRSEA